MTVRSKLSLNLGGFLVAALLAAPQAIGEAAGESILYSAPRNESAMESRLWAAVESPMRD